MSTEIDFKALWNNGESRIPAIQEVFAKANRLNRKTRRKIWWENTVLGLSAVFIGWVWWHYQPQMITTKIGITMIVGAVIMFLIFTNQLFPMLKDGNVATDSRKYLQQMILVKQKQEFIGSKLMAIYYIFLTVGLALYLIEYSARGSLTFKICFYSLTFGWMAFGWFYFVPRRLKRQRKAINEVIEKLEEINGQLGE